MIDRRWRRAVALTLVASVACVLLGFWQLDRRASRLETIAVVQGNWDASPRSLAQVLPAGSAPLGERREFTPVAVSGTYDPAGTLLVRNRPQDGVFGYLVLVPLRLDAASGGGVLVVNRGWIPPGESGAAPGEVPAPPQGEVRAVVRLRAPEPADGRSAPRGQVQRVDLGGTVRRALRAEGVQGLDADLVTRAYGQLATESARSPVAPTLALEPDADPGPHLGYSVQWFVFAAGMWVLLGVQVRRSRAEEDAVLAGLPSPGKAARARSAARRTVDEDAEDAALDAAELRAAVLTPHD